MYSINLKKFQNTPRGPSGKAVEGEKRIRLPQIAFEDDSVAGRSRSLHPTKGWRSRNLEVIRRNGEVIQELDILRQRAVHRLLIERAEREKLKARSA